MESTDTAQDEDQWVEWEDALQGHALNLEKTTRFEDCVMGTRGIMRQTGDSPRVSYYAYKDIEDDMDRDFNYNRMQTLDNYSGTTSLTIISISDTLKRDLD